MVRRSLCEVSRLFFPWGCIGRVVDGMTGRIGEAVDRDASDRP